MSCRRRRRNISVCKLKACKINTNKINSCKIHTNKLAVDENADIDKLYLNQDENVITVGSDKDFKTLNGAIQSLQDCVLMNTVIKLDEGEYDFSSDIDGYIPVNPLKIEGDTREIAATTYINGDFIFLDRSVKIDVTNQSDVSLLKIFLAEPDGPVEVEKEGLVVGDKIKFFLSDTATFLDLNVISVNGIEFVVDGVIPENLTDGSSITFMPNVTVKNITIKESCDITGIFVDGILYATNNAGIKTVSLNNIVSNEGLNGFTLLVEGIKSIILKLFTSLNGNGILLESPSIISNVYSINSQIQLVESTNSVRLRIVNAGLVLDKNPDHVSYNDGTTFLCAAVTIFNSPDVAIDIKSLIVPLNVSITSSNILTSKVGIRMKNSTNAYINNTTMKDIETGLLADSSFVTVKSAKLNNYTDKAFNAINGGTISLLNTPALIPEPGAEDYCIDGVFSRIGLGGQLLGNIC